MKRIIVAFIFAIGMLAVWPPGTQAMAANSDQVSFVADHQPVVPTAAMLQDNYVYDQIGNVKYLNVIYCKEGGDVEVQVFTLVTRPTNLIENKLKALNFTEYSNYSFRICTTDAIPRSNLMQKNKVSVNRFARDGLTQV